MGLGRVTTATLVTLALLVGAAIIDEFQFARRALLAQISDQLDQPVAARSLRIQLGSPLKIIAQDLTVGAVGDAAEPPLLTVEQLQIQANLADLLRTPARIERVELSSPTLTLRVNEDGSNNWQSQETFDDDSTDEDTPVPAVIDELHVDGAVIHYEDPLLGPTKTARLTAQQTVIGERIELTIEGSLNNTELAFKASATPRDEVLRLGATSIAFAGHFGQISLDGHVAVKNLLRPDRPELSINVQGPNLAYLTERLELPPVGNGPMRFTLTTQPQKANMALTLSGQFGNYMAMVLGELDTLRALDTGNLTVALSGPDASKLKRLLGGLDLPMVPFSVAGKVLKEGPQLTIKKSRLTLGRLQINAAGTIPNYEQPGVADLTFDAAVPDIAILQDALQLPETLTGPIDADFAVNNSTQGAQVGGQIRTNWGTVTLAGDLSKEPDLSGSILRADLSGSDANALLSALGLSGALDPHLPEGVYQADIALQIEPDSFRIGSFRVATSRGTLTGDALISQSFDAIQTSLNSDDVSGFFSAVPLPDGFRAESLQRPLSAQATMTRTADTFALSELKISAGDAVIAGRLSTEEGDTVNADLRFNIPHLAQYADEHSTLKGADPLNVSGRMKAHLSSGHVRFDDVWVTIPDGSNIDVKGQLFYDDTFTNSQLSVVANIDNLAHFSHFVGRTLPSQNLRIQTQLIGSESTLRARSLSLRTGRSQLSGEFSVTDPEHPTVSLQLHAPYLDAEPWLMEEERPQTNTQASTDKRLIPDMPLGVGFLQGFDADVDIAVDKLAGHPIPIRNLQVQASSRNGVLTIGQMSLEDDAQGRLQLSGVLAPHSSGVAAALTVRGDGINIGFPAVSPDHMALLPKYDIDSLLFSQGDTTRTLAANSNGYISVRGGGGQVAKLSGGFLTNDFFTELLELLNPLHKAKDYTDIECLAVTTVVEQGKMTGNPAVVVATKNLDISARAKIDLGTEKLFASFNTIAKQGLGISASHAFNPFVGVGGTLAKPAVTIDPEGTLVQGGMAFFTGGLSLLTKGLVDRAFSSKTPCESAIAGNEQQRQHYTTAYQAFTADLTK